MNKFIWLRAFSRTIRRHFSTPTPPPSEGQNATFNMKYSPSEFQKIILVWTKKYKSKQDVPKWVSLDLIERSRNEARIKLANILMVLTALGSLGAVLAGKAAAKRGDSVHQMNIDWHDKYNESCMPKETETEKKYTKSN